VAGDFMVPATGSANGFVVDRDDLLRVPARFEHHEASESSPVDARDSDVART
jgi:hypothetical protein